MPNCSAVTAIAVWGTFGVLAILGQVVKVRAARAREEALSFNREGQFKKAPAVIEAEMAQLMEFGDLPAVQSEVASLRGLLSSFAGPMDAIDAKKMRMASYAVRRSRHDPSPRKSASV